MKENIMNTLKMTLVLALVLLLTGCNEVSQTQPNADGKTYVLVHGAWGGGWAFREVDDLLTAQGHKVYRPTLTGQGERVHLATLDVGLETHITDVVNTVLFEELDDIVLMGHSYGGMVVTGVADRIPDRISQLIYLDAFVPEDGQSVRGNKTDADWTTRSVKDGYIIPTWVPAHKPYPKDVPHPPKTGLPRPCHQAFPFGPPACLSHEPQPQVPFRTGHPSYRSGSGPRQ